MYLKIGVVGCSHGEVDKLYGLVEENSKDRPVDVLLCCGDVQTIRFPDDLKYFCARRQDTEVKQFAKYFSGQKKCPVLTIFIGGNHEASNVLQQLHHGGWIAPNFFYLGRSGVIRLYKGPHHYITIGGLSGIYKNYDYNKGYFEYPPYTPSTLRSVYHTREFDIDLISLYSGHLDILMTHDWPRGIAHYGNKEELYRIKPSLAQDIERNVLGSPATEKLLSILNVDRWYAGHLHIKFEALVPRGENKNIEFLALDKPIRLDKCVAFQEIPMQTVHQVNSETTSIPTHCSASETSDHSSTIHICFDPQWLGILISNYDQAPFYQHRLQSSIHCKPATEIISNSLMTRLQSKTCTWCQCSSDHYPWFEWRDEFKDLQLQRRIFLNEILDTQRDYYNEQSWTGRSDTAKEPQAKQPRLSQEEIDITLEFDD